ncbi:PRKCA-binding protein [Carcharodon carcharias]|uniref:PRKCA-binding protein n=1 Tax=Carcharodon carcharias TaxID=13397 RepID=UPI001B7E0AC3|nr:PRKCA-binding protein [Carcharodon carcharias]XP_041034057.1 PRKCA-binding protein [Carcharodon carcharias]
MFGDMDFEIEEDKLGIPTVPGTVTLKKDSQNLIGISIGGGAQYCPCLYIVQVFDNTPAAVDGTLAAGDEIVGVTGKSVKGKTKVEVAKMIQAVKGEVTIHYNKLQADPKQGKTLDIVLKKVKHRLVENMSSGTADALGLSRAILCNDGLVKKLEELERTAELYRGLMEHTKRLLRAFFELSQTHRGFGDVFSVIGVREPQPAASEAFVKFAEAHRSIEKFGIRLLKTVKPMLSDLNTYLNKAIPDTKLTIKKYLDVKFEYLSYCLKVKEMDDEEYSCIALQEPLYRVGTGNYEYRLILRCRQEARARFAKMRKDVLEKIELLDQKHVQDIVFQLQRFVSAMSKYYDECYAVLKDADVFPIEVDLTKTMLNYSPKDIYTEAEEEDEKENEENGEKLFDDE